MLNFILTRYQHALEPKHLAFAESFRSLIEPHMRDAANAILEEQKVFPGIDLVLFTEFLMQ